MPSPPQLPPSGMNLTPVQTETTDGMRIIILGAGASGLAAAILLAREHRANVTVYERLGDISQADEESYPIGVNPRGMKVLKMVDPSLEQKIDVTKHGKIAGWSIWNSKKEIARLASGTVVGTTRGKVVEELYNTARDTPNVEIKLNRNLVHADMERLQMTFAVGGAGGGGTEEEEVVDFAAARVLDCTGCWSKMRTAVAAVDASLGVETWPWDITFRNLFTEPTPAAVNLDPTLHYIFTTAEIYAAVLSGERWAFSLSINPARNPGCEWMLADSPSAENVARLKAHVAEHCPAAASMLSDAEYSRFFMRRGFSGQVVRLARLNHGERVAFLGDAAHAVIPSTGEGVNSSLEDVGVLVRSLTAGDAGGWLSRFNAARIADARAVSEYAAYLLEGMKADAAERNRRTAAMVLSGIGQKMGVLTPTWGDKSFGKLSPRMEPYSVIHTDWKRQMKKVEPWGNRLIYWFAKDGGRKQVRAAKKKARLLSASSGGELQAGMHNTCKARFWKRRQ